MVRTQIQFTQEQLDALRARAARLEVSVAEVVRRAVDDWLEGAVTPTEEERRRRALEAVGRFSSGCDDTARRHDEHLADAYRS